MMRNLKKLLLLLCSLFIAAGCASQSEKKDNRDLSDKLEDRWDNVDDAFEDTADSLKDKGKRLGGMLDDIF